MKIFKRIAAKLVDMEDYQYKQVIIMRQDLKLPKGKMAAQAAHASVEAVLKSDKNKISDWRNVGSKKVVLKVENEKELYRYIQFAKDADIITSVITDAGKTVIAPGTVTCGAIGPDSEEKIDRITGKLGMV
jgi:PTH2 family peptidyl-tRNA hydrolase